MVILGSAPYLALIPPIVAIALALWKKETYSALFIGVLLAALLQFDFNPLTAIQYLFETMSTVIGGNAAIIIFLCLLGILVVLMSRAGGSRSYGIWAGKKLKKRSAAMLATAGLGALIFVDDYFNCLTVGTVMRPVTDQKRISRAKLAYLIDATAAPICIIAPISSWALSVGGTIESAAPGMNGFTAFIQTIPYNLYAILTILMLIVLSVTKIDFGSMKRFERNAMDRGDLFTTKGDRMVAGGNDYKISDRGRVFDLIIPIAVLIIVSILFMFYTGGLFSGTAFTEVFGKCDPYISMVVGGFSAIVAALILYLPRKLMTFKESMDSLPKGITQMVPAILILVLAWTLVQACKDSGATQYISDLIAGSGMPLGLLPAIIFVIAAALAFATGTSWGTFGILLAFVVPLMMEQGELFFIAVSATLAGAVCGDHMSPISDTTILASTGAECNHVDHVKTQIPYVLTVAVVCFIGYLLAGFTQMLWLTLLVSIPLLPLAIWGAKILFDKIDNKKPSTENAADAVLSDTERSAEAFREKEKEE